MLDQRRCIQFTIRFHDPHFITPHVKRAGRALAAGVALGVAPLCYRPGYGYGMRNKVMMLITENGRALLSDYAKADLPLPIA